MNRRLCLAIAVFSAAGKLAPGQAIDLKQAAWMNRTLTPDQRADLVIQQMTLDEKIQLLHGAGMKAEGAPDPSRTNGGAGFVPGIARLGIPDLNLADSAVGVTRGNERSRYSTPLPNALALAATWDAKLGNEYGALIGRELRDQGYNVSLGGGVNLLRDPHNGRNFEYQGEDPILAGKMVAQVIKGLQAQGVVGDIKHFALNDQETGRHIANVKMDKRTMRETDLLAFEIGIREGEPGAVMCSYNRVNGDYACENRYLLTDVLRTAWGFKGYVMSDWYGTYSTAKAALAGVDQEQPGPEAYFSKDMKKAVEDGSVPMTRIHEMLRRILRSAFAAGIIDNPPVQRVVDVFAGLEFAQRVAEQSTVLLKNSGILPLTAPKSIAVIGMHANVGVLSGGGSAQVDPPGGNAVKVPPPPDPPGQPRTEYNEIWGNAWVWYPSSPLKSIRARSPRTKVEFNDGSDAAAAAALAKSSEVAIVFAVQPSSEGRDTSLSLPYNQDALIAAVAAANPRTIVVLENGNPVLMPWLDKVQAVLESWYPGIRGAEAIANILFGDVNPSGKLPATFSKSESDLPHEGVFQVPPGRMSSPGGGAGGKMGPMVEPFDIEYKEGLKVGYKWFDAEGKQPLFAFGHGLSYTTFAYSGLKTGKNEVTFTVRNTGKREGIEIAQVYAGLPAAANEPPRRLVAWEKIRLTPGESKTVTLKLDPQFLSVFSEAKDAWELLPGEYNVFVGGSSRNTPLTAALP